MSFDDYSDLLCHSWLVTVTLPATVGWSQTLPLTFMSRPNPCPVMSTVTLTAAVDSKQQRHFTPKNFTDKMVAGETWSRSMSCMEYGRGTYVCSVISGGMVWSVTVMCLGEATLFTCLWAQVSQGAMAMVGHYFLWGKWAMTTYWQGKNRLKIGPPPPHQKNKKKRLLEKYERTCQKENV